MKPIPTMSGAMPNIAPTVVATPLPPLKRRNIDQLCPATDAHAYRREVAIKYSLGTAK